VILVFSAIKFLFTGSRHTHLHYNQRVFSGHLAEPGYDFRDLTVWGKKPGIGVAEMRCGRYYAFLFSGINGVYLYPETYK